jgi:hypothetical protein
MRAPQDPPASDREWLIASGVIAAASALLAIGLMLGLSFSALPAPRVSLASWFAWTVFAGGASIILYTVQLLLAGEEKPIDRMRDNWRTGRDRYVAIAIGMTLAGFDMYSYMILKPILDLVTPFWADPALARIDFTVLGTDAWRLFSGWNLEWVAVVYSPFWFFGVLLTFYWLLLRPPSRIKSAAILTYFVIWSVFGTVGQALIPAGGPIFYHRLGFGDRFDPMHVPALAGGIADYLWQTYKARSLAPGAGISAMPSLHIATMTWLVLVFAVYRSRWLFVAVPLSLFIYCGSVALGWHYAVDGVAGAAGAGVCFAACRAWFRDRAEQPGSGVAGTAQPERSPVRMELRSPL